MGIGYYAVIDTNVLVSALLSKHSDSATVKVLEAVLDGRIIPLYHKDMLTEYYEVLMREKFHFSEEAVRKLLYFIIYCDTCRNDRIIR